jgi:transcriptional regulator with XRE-family HTH domain
MITTRQVKAARALLDWSQADLAKASGVSLPTIARLEADDGPLGGLAATGDAIKITLERAGAVFILDNGGGVKLRKVSRAKR